MTALYHYTCSHMAPLIGARGLLVPRRQPLLGGWSLVWLTDLDVADRAALGLTSNWIDCDRTEVRYRVVTPDDCVPWADWARRGHVERSRISALTFGCQPAHWWVSEQPVKVRR